MLKIGLCSGLALLFVGCGGVCGDGALDKNEACDDGNTADIVDGCSADCSVIETGQDFVLPPAGTAFGHTYEDLSVSWQQWLMIQPRDANPAFDDTGAFGSAFQPTDVWFLAGTAGGNATRSITIPPGTLPEGRPIFFPILSSGFITFPGIDPAFNAVADICSGDVTVACTVATEAVDCAGIGACITGEANARAAAGIDGTEILTLEIDGEVVTADGAATVDNLLDFRTVDGGVFAVEMPDFNFFDGADPLTENFCQTQACVDAGAAGNSAGIYPDCVSDGYFIMLSPLPAGAHTLRFTGIDGAFALDVTYNLTVE